MLCSGIMILINTYSLTITIVNSITDNIFLSGAVSPHHRAISSCGFDDGAAQVLRTLYLLSFSLLGTVPGS